MIRLEKACRDFQVGDQVVHALDHVDLEITSGEYISVMGPSGSGKSTLLNILGLLDRLNSGGYWLNDADVSSLDDDALAEQRQQNIGFIFQAFHLIPRLSALENVELPLLLAGAPVAARRERAREVLDSVGLASRLEHRPDQLSGGERQRVIESMRLAGFPTCAKAPHEGHLAKLEHFRFILVHIHRQRSSFGILGY